MIVTKNENVGTTTLTLDGHDLAILKQAIAHDVMNYNALLKANRFASNNQKIDWEEKRDELNSMSAALGGNKY